MTELLLKNDNLIVIKKFKIKNFSFFGFFTCIATLVLAFLFKDYLIYLLNYLELKSNSNIVEFHFILLSLFICVSLPILWGYLICVLICSFVYTFFIGFIMVVFYSSIGMTCSFFICRYTFYECAHQRVNDMAYLKAISSVIESSEKGFKIIVLSRLMPIPFGLVNTLFSVTDVRFKNYLFASIIGLVPSQLLLCYTGSMLRSMSDVLSNESTAKTASLVFFFQVLIAIGVMYYILNSAKNELDKHLINKINNNISSIEQISNITNIHSINGKESLNKCECENCILLKITVNTE